MEFMSLSISHSASSLRRQFYSRWFGVALESAVLIQGPEGSGADPLATTSDRAQNHITETEYPSTGSAVVKMVTKGLRG
ncbi:hypothetical protein CDV31_014795 [Fusarium ambrosium]|uniref:Uncharacterized protein n=1 Tax=Fusarium ambrosium TaxID=131363 RepID=A0A428SU08_9HYPO|nr:hypothetical protein CDV31_014795 [Fusarium ambrosium]